MRRAFLIPIVLLAASLTARSDEKPALDKLLAHPIVAPGQTMSELQDFAAYVELLRIALLR